MLNSSLKQNKIKILNKKKMSYNENIKPKKKKSHILKNVFFLLFWDLLKKIFVQLLNNSLFFKNYYFFLQLTSFII